MTCLFCSVPVLSERCIFFKKQNDSPATGKLKRPDAMPDDAIRGRVMDLILTKITEGNNCRMMHFKEVAATKYRPDITERNEKEVWQVVPFSVYV